MIIDVHTHIYSKKTLIAYQKKTLQKINKVVALAWYKKNNFGWLDTNELVKFANSEPKIYAVGSIDMKGQIKKQLGQMEKFFKKKEIVGIKLYPGYQYFYPSDKEVFDIAKLCAKYNKPLIFHAGDVFEAHDGALLKYSRPIHIDELAHKCANTKIVISHFGFPYYMETANIISKNKNVYADISGTIDNCETSMILVNLINQYIVDLKRVFNYFPGIKKKVMFATDYSGDDTQLNKVQPYIDVVETILDQKNQKNAFHELAEKLFF